MRFKTYSAVLLLVSLAVPAGALDFEYQVVHEHLLRDCRGVLRFSPEGVEYVTPDKKDSRKWNFDDIRTLELNSPSRISITTYEDQKRLAGKDRVFAFTLTGRKATSELSSFLLEHVQKPMRLAVIPHIAESPAFEIPVKHLRAVTGSRGVLRIYHDKVVYQSSMEGESRYWRMKDIERFSQPDRYRLQIVGQVPKSGGPTEAYDFQLLREMPEELYDYLWVRLHPSSYYPATPSSE